MDVAVRYGRVIDGPVIMFRDEAFDERIFNDRHAIHPLNVFVPIIFGASLSLSPNVSVAGHAAELLRHSFSFTIDESLTYERGAIRWQKSSRSR